jgi:hypothetical protein
VRGSGYILGASERHDSFTDLQYTAVNVRPELASEFLANCRYQLETGMKVKQIVHASSIQNKRSTMECSSRVPRQVKRSKRKAAFVVKKHLTLTALPQPFLPHPPPPSELGQTSPTSPNSATMVAIYKLYNVAALVSSHLAASLFIALSCHNRKLTQHRTTWLPTR